MRSAMTLATTAFVVLLLYAHGAADADPLVARPLSEFRDGDRGWFGYLLFSLLILVTGIMIAVAVRSRREPESAVFSLIGLLLAVVAATPSRAAFHALCSFLLLSLLYFYFALVVYRAAGVGPCVMHLLVPGALLLATEFHSYGLWQKGLIVYFVLAVYLHFLFLSRQPPRPEVAVWRPPSRGWARDKRGMVYVVSPGRSWPAARRRRG